MNAFESAVKIALSRDGESHLANKAYLEFLKANFIIPIEKRSDEEVRVLYLPQDETVLLPVFSNKSFLDAWAEPIKDEMNLLHLSAIDLLKGIEANVTIAMNIGSEIYKEFNPSEIERMKSMVLKLFK